MKIGIFPGSFDPITNGHMDIIERAKNICDKVIVAIGLNSAKRSLFSVEERIGMIEKCCQIDDSIDEGIIEVTSFDGLLVDLCKDMGASLIVRGIRAISDFEYEYAIALLNKKLVSLQYSDEN